MQLSDIEHNIRVIRERIEQACKRSGRNPEEVKLMLVTKTVPVERIQMALDAGENLIGENKVQEGLQKREPLTSANPSLDFHFIGHLQTNKVKDVLKFATCIQSVDRMKLATALHERLQKEGRTMDVLIQVNTSYEESKFGAAPEDALALIQEVAKLDTLRIKGLMTIGLFTDDQDKVRKCFKLLQNIRREAQELALPNVSMEVMSMGMSGDFETAIEEGSTLVRVGSAIFGKRIYPDSHYWNENSKSE
ncbi:YggS family pyridoxal phosphate-dependent enzyme [Paenibacillus sp. B1-33]|uniref:YggS family pyridoxal phosphate-dependent enzyme n=1 Tax=unclassified Paenibacillus TaxID=185978 RepID=UPI003D296A07